MTLTFGVGPLRMWLRSTNRVFDWPIPVSHANNGAFLMTNPSGAYQVIPVSNQTIRSSRLFTLLLCSFSSPNHLSLRCRYGRRYLPLSVVYDIPLTISWCCATLMLLSQLTTVPQTLPESFHSLGCSPLLPGPALLIALSCSN